MYDVSDLRQDALLFQNPYHSCNHLVIISVVCLMAACLLECQPRKAGEQVHFDNPSIPSAWHLEFQQIFVE